MIKLIQNIRDKRYYWEIWQEGEHLLVHEGIVGSSGKQAVINAEPDYQRQMMTDLSQLVIGKGYKMITIDDLTDIVIQYKINGFGTEDELNKRFNIQFLMNECLGWTGNGYCDGGDIGNGTMNIFCYVIDVERALMSIKQELNKHGYLAGAVIACEKEDEYVALYPKGSSYLI